MRCLFPSNHPEIKPESANARLIAAAPEMLEALQYAQLWFSDIANPEISGMHACELIEAAIRKAVDTPTGGEGRSTVSNAETKRK
jgi:CheY-like chemotaxis protein